MAVTIGGRAIAIFNVGGSLNAVNQSTWQTIAQNFFSALGGPIEGITLGVNFNAFAEVLSDGTNNYVRIVCDDAQVANTYSAATVATNFVTAITNNIAVVKTVLAGFSSLGGTGITFNSVSFNPWGDGFVPSP